jgi:hypothetical protein
MDASRNPFRNIRKYRFLKRFLTTRSDDEILEIIFLLNFERSP